MGRRLANIDIEYPKTLNQFRSDQCLTRQRHAFSGSIERSNDAALELGRFQLKAIGHFVRQAGPGFAGGINP
jgi:hypothetical protein